MVVVNAQIGVICGFSRRPVVLGAEGDVCHGGSLKIHEQREGEGVAHVLLLCLFAVVDVCGHGDRVLRIVFEVLLERAEFDFHSGRDDRTAVVERFALVVFGTAEYLSARGVFHDGDRRLFDVAQKPRIDIFETVDRGRSAVLLVGDGDVFLAGGDLRGGGILREGIRAERQDVIVVQPADRAGGIGVGHQLVFGIETVVDLVGVGVVILFVEDGSFRPVAVEGEHRNVHVDVGAAHGVQRDESFHIHTVCERFVHILFIFVGESDADGNGGRAVPVHRDAVAVLAAAVHACDRHRGARKQVAVHRDGRVAVAGIGGADPFRHDDGAEIIGHGTAAHVVYVKLHLVDAALALVVAEFEFGLFHLVAVRIVRRDVRSGGSRFGNIDKTRALLADRVREPVLVIDDVRRGHHELVHEGCDVRRRHVAAEHAAVTDILADERRRARHVGRSHRSTGHPVITLPGHGRIDLAAVRRDLGFDLQIGSRAP